MIGTGASAIQFVPEVQQKVDRLSLFQRTPPWIIPRGDRQLTGRERAVFRAVPAAQRLVRLSIFLTQELSAVGFLHPRVLRVAQRVAERHLRRSVPDPDLRARLTPNYTMGCKRVLRSDDYLPALTQPNVDLVTTGIREVTPGRDRHHGRRRAPRRHDHLRHRVPRHGPADRRAGAGPRRPQPRRRLAGQPRGLPRHQRGRLPEPASCCSARAPASATPRWST